MPTTTQTATAEESDEGSSLLQTVDAITSRVTAQARQCQPMQQSVAMDELADVSSQPEEASAKPAPPHMPRTAADASAGATERSKPAQDSAYSSQEPVINGKILLLANVEAPVSAEGDKTVRTNQHTNARCSHPATGVPGAQSGRHLAQAARKPATGDPRAQSGRHLAQSAQHHLWGSLEMKEWLAHGRPSPRRHIWRPLQREASCSASPRSMDRCSACSHRQLNVAHRSHPRMSLVA